MRFLFEPASLQERIERHFSERLDDVDHERFGGAPIEWRLKRGPFSACSDDALRLVEHLRAARPHDLFWLTATRHGSFTIRALPNFADRVKHTFDDDDYIRGRTPHHRHAYELALFDLTWARSQLAFMVVCVNLAYFLELGIVLQFAFLILVFSAFMSHRSACQEVVYFHLCMEREDEKWLFDAAPFTKKLATARS